DAAVDLLPLLVRAHRRERRRRDLDAEVQRAERPGVDERAVAAGADEEPADLVERLLRRRETDALYGALARRERLEPFERQGQVAAPLVPDEGVDLVDDRRRDRLQHLAPGVARQEQV